jgi:hypothetical protein
MTNEEINNQLYRPLKSGLQYNKFFPNSSCSNTKLATGNTKVAINEMAKWAKKYASHSELIAPELIGYSLEDTVNNIQNFLYNHIQYSIDGSDQMLKSPACAWATRHEGTDCKSYSIFASTILLNLGVKHYLRRIKQAVMSDAFTHVYVIIPIDQDKAKLNKGYYVIDGTIQYNDELPFNTKDDIYMEPALNIYGLAAPTQGLGCGANTNCGCANTLDVYGGVQPTQAMGGFLDNIFGGGWSPSCIGGTYDKNDYNKFEQLVSGAFEQLYLNFNQAVTSGNVSAIQETANIIIISSAQLSHQATRTAAKSWSSSCSKSTTKGFRDLANYFDNMSRTVFIPFLQNYFSFITQPTGVPNNTYPFAVRADGKGMKDEFITNPIQVMQIAQMQLKATTTDIPKFEFTPYLLENVGNAGFNLNNFLNSLTEVAGQFGSGSNNGNGQNNGNGNVIDFDPQTPTTKTAGGGVGMFLLVSAIAGTIIFKDKIFPKNAK